jgi:hypothetical protein
VGKKADIDFFDVEDVSFDLPKSKNRCEVVIVMKSDTPFNLVKLFLALGKLHDQMENEMGVFDEHETIQ